MGKRDTDKPTVGPASPPTPEGLRNVWVEAEPLVIGRVQVAFILDAAPESEIVLCLDEGRMVGLVVRGAISARALRKIPVRSLERFAIGVLRKWSDAYRSPWFSDTFKNSLPDGSDEFLRGFESKLQAYEAATRAPLGTGTSKEWNLAVLAARYVVLCAASPSPTKDLAAERCMSVATVRDQLGEARRSGLLQYPGSGRAGGELTPQAVALLHAGEED